METADMSPLEVPWSGHSFHGVMLPTLVLPTYRDGIPFRRDRERDGRPVIPLSQLRPSSTA